MEVLGSVTVGEKNVVFVKVPLEKVLDRTGFVGQKIFHLFDFDKEEVTYTKNVGGKKYKGKNKKTEQVTRIYLHYKDGHSITDAKKVLDDPNTVFEVKFDGGCGLLQYSETEEKYLPYTRRDVKKDKDGQWKERKETWIPCQEEPTVPEANHWPHMVCCYEEPNAYKWMIQAFENLEKTGILANMKKSFTIEWMGKKCNPCKTDPIDDDLTIVPHGAIRVQVPLELRNYEGIKSLITSCPFIEGLVCHSEHGVYKIRRDLFWADDGKRNMSWGNKDITEYKDMGFDFANGHGLANYVKIP